MNECPVCGNTFAPYRGMRGTEGDYWCESCQDVHDSIDWDEYYEKQRGKW